MGGEETEAVSTAAPAQSPSNLPLLLLLLLRRSLQPLPAATHVREDLHALRAEVRAEAAQL